jgi:hypothetical protein
VYLNSVIGGDDFIILNPRWMCHDVIGYLLSRDTVERSRPTGHYTADELHLMFPDCDGDRIVRLLKSIELCAEITDSSDSELEYELPCYTSIQHGRLFR